MAFSALSAALDVRNKISRFDTSFRTHQLPDVIRIIKAPLPSRATIFLAYPVRLFDDGQGWFSVCTTEKSRDVRTGDVVLALSVLLELIA